MAIDTQTHNITQIHAGSQAIAEAHIWTGSEWKKVWPDAPVEQFSITHTKQTGFTITVGCSTYNLVTINWGDGTSTVVNNSTAKTHNYASSSTYTVTITGDLTKITIFQCNNQLVSAITLTQDCQFITNFQVTTNNLRSLDVHYLTRLYTFYCNSNSLLTSLIMPYSLVNVGTRDYQIFSTAISNYVHPLAAGTHTNFRIHLCANLVTLDISSITSASIQVTAYSCPKLETVNASSLTSTANFSIYSCPKLTQLNVNSLTTCTNFNVYSNIFLASLNLSNLVNCTNLSIYSNTTMSELNVNSLATCDSFYCYLTAVSSLNVYINTCTYFHVYSNSQLATINIPNLTTCFVIDAYSNVNLTPPTMYFTSIAGISFRNDALSESEVDSVLANCLTISNSDASCSLNLGGTNARPSTSGYASKAMLISRGWTVTTN